jgi:hypothetical protein
LERGQGGDQCGERQPSQVDQVGGGVADIVFVVAVDLIAAATGTGL